jgi:hypothetical protein
MNSIDWSKQHCGVHQAEAGEMFELMPDIKRMIIDTFPERVSDFIWDVKVHMLMPNQFPCIPNWHFDNVPRVNNRQDFDLIKPDAPMYLWLSGAPLTEFRRDGRSWLVNPREWVKFTQKDEHRGTISSDFAWRGFIRATHKDIAPQRPKNKDVLRRHCQVYLDAANFSW